MTKAIRRHGVPEKSTIDGSAANEAAIKSYHAEQGTAPAIRQIKDLNTIGEQDHRDVKRVTRPMLGCKSVEAAQGTLVGLELMPMIQKKQRMVEAGDEGRTAADQCSARAASSPHRQGLLPLHDLLSKICDRTVIYKATSCTSYGRHAPVSPGRCPSKWARPSPRQNSLSVCSAFGIRCEPHTTLLIRPVFASKSG